ncbi:COP9 signalosome complex subunit 8 [Gamsiella multidivaricata]|nr:COP9 signalosome complex subunit 8 [Gamsiella multidivaricata]
MTVPAQQIFEQADAYLKAGRYQELIPLYEQLEFQVSAIEIDAVPLNTIYEPLLASYLIAHDLYSARSLVHRIPEDYRAQAPQLATLIQVMELMRQWERQNGNLKDIYALLHQSRWNSSLAPLIAVLQDSIQDRELDLLAKAYTSLPVQLAASRIWLEEDSAAEQLVATRGWRYDATTRLLYPKSRESAPNRSIGLQEFGQLADVVAHLEVKQDAS